MFLIFHLFGNIRSHFPSDLSRRIIQGCVNLWPLHGLNTSFTGWWSQSSLMWTCLLLCPPCAAVSMSIFELWLTINWSARFPSSILAQSRPTVCPRRRQQETNRDSRKLQNTTRDRRRQQVWPSTYSRIGSGSSKRRRCKLIFDTEK